MAGIDGHPEYPSGQAELPIIRVAIGLGNAERERILLSTLAENGDLVIVDRCLSVDQLLSLVRRGDVDVVLVGITLHRLNHATAMELARNPVPVVLLAEPNADSPWSEILGSDPAVGCGCEPDPTGRYRRIRRLVGRRLVTRHPIAIDLFPLRQPLPWSTRQLVVSSSLREGMGVRVVPRWRSTSRRHSVP